MLVTVYFISDGVHPIAFGLDSLKFVATVFTDFHFGTVEVVVTFMTALALA
jgi:translation elongation factor EF-1beta